jgi:glycosyltransferase involved in cell wall biosynthesis
MRVLMVSSLWPPEVLGGAERYASDLGERLRDAGHEVAAVTLGVDGPDVVAQVKAWPYPLRDFAAQSATRRAAFHLADVARPDAARVLGRALARFRPDVVHTHAVQGMGAAALTQPGRAGVAHVHTLHDYWLLCQRNSLVRRDGTACATRCVSCRSISFLRAAQVRRHAPEVVIAVSEAIAGVHRAALPWLRDRIEVVYNPVTPVPVPSRTAGTRVPFTFGFLGRLGRDKGILTLLDAFADARLADARLVVAGRGPEAAAVEAAGGAVEARGWLEADALEAFLAELDCLVVPSQWPDPAPLVVNEARARGITVVGSTAGGIPELVATEHRDLLVPPADRAALTAALRRVAAAPGRFAVAPAALPIGWPEHLAAVEAAYGRARRPV